MMKFVLKTALVGGLAAGAAVALVGPDKVEDWVFASKAAVEEKLNEFQGMSSELRKIESRIDRMNGEISDLKEGVLKEEFEIKNLDKEIDGREEALDYLRGNLEKAQTLLEGNNDWYAIRGINYSRTEIEQDVEEKIRLYQIQKDTLDQLHLTLDTRLSALQMQRENVAKGQAVREELIGKVRYMQAKLERYKARQFYAEAISSDFDAKEFNTEIGDARKRLAKFEQKLDVKSQLLDNRMRVAVNDKNMVGGIDYTKTTEANLSIRDQLSALLNGTDEEMVAANK